MSGPTFSRFDSDPEALAWARGHVEGVVAWARDFEQKAADRGDEELSLRWRRFANLLEMKFVGGKGCVITAFDERKPVIVAALEEGRSDG